MVETRRDTSVRRQQIISAARKLIVKYGSEHVTVRRIAREIGVSEGAIYRHFKSKREILSFLIDEIEDILMADIQGDYTNADALNTLEMLDKIMRKHISSLEQRNGISFQVIAEIVSFGDKRLSKKMHDVISKYIGRIAGILAGGVKAGVIRQDIDPEAMSTLFFGTIQGLVNLWALSNYSFNLEQRYIPIYALLREVIIRR